MNSIYKPVSLGLYIKQVRGITFKPVQISDIPFDGSIAVLKANNITDIGLDDSSLIYIDVSRVKKEQFIKAGDILLAASSGSIKVIGKNIYFPDDYRASFGAFCKLVRPKDGLHPEYLKHFFKTPYYKKTIERSVQGANINNLKNEHLDKLEIPFPPLDEQIRLANLLCKVEGLLSRRKEHLLQLDDLLKSVFLEMFGDPVRNEKGWDTLPFDKVGKFISGGTPSKSREDYWSGNFPWVSPKDMKVSSIEDSIDHISENVFKETSLKRISSRHMLIVVRGMILAHSFPVAINNVEVAINQDMKAIKPIKSINIVYLQNCLVALKRQILKLISSAAHGTRKFDTISMQKLFIPKPPEDLQNQFATIVEKIEGIKSHYQESLTELENLYGALSQRAFKGELSEPVSVKEKIIDPEERFRVLGQWLDDHLTELNGKPFSAERFMEFAQQKTWDFLEDDAYQLCVAEYDHIKELVFEALKSGRLKQTFVDNENRVQVA